MKTFFATLAAATVAGASYVCPATLSSADAAAITYGYKVQSLLDSYYKSIPVNASYFSSLPMASSTQSNGMTMAENTVTNVRGLAQQASLGKQALTELGMQIGITESWTPCNYEYPPAPNGTAHIMNAFYFEATMCGAFIGLADYVESPQAAFLSARLAAEHGIHASALRAMMQAVGFMPNSTSLTPAFTPETIMQEGMEVGHLGTFLNGCAAAPAAPCNGEVTIGDLLATLSGQSASMASVVTGTYVNGSAPVVTGTYVNGSASSGTGISSSASGIGNSSTASGNGTGSTPPGTHASSPTTTPYTGAAGTLQTWSAGSLVTLVLSFLIL